MKYLLLLMALTFTLQLQPDQQEQRDDKYASDPHAVCMRPEVKDYYEKKNPSAHACSCKTSCVTQGDGSTFEQMSRDCSLDCTRTRCQCHPDENACDMPLMQRNDENDSNPFSNDVVPR